VIVLDTNVLSEPLRERPDDGVLAWLSSVDSDVTATAVSIGELLVGARRLPQGRRRDGLLAAIDGIATSFEDQVLPYDLGASRRYAAMQADRRSAGRPLSTEDGMIAAICAENEATLATRNVRDFDGLGVVLINPWDLPTTS
jgi:predicted nucleic acid-binding protein